MVVSRRALLALLLAPAAVALLSGGAARAHQVYVFAWVEGNTVYTESYFGGKRKVAGGTVRVYDPSGEEIVSGETDREGMFSFPLPGRMDLRVVLEASTGHRAEYRLGSDEIPAGRVSQKPGPQEDQEEGKGRVVRRGDEPRGTAGNRETAVDAEAVRIVVERALDERLNPLVRSVARLREERGPGVTEILGGIGYIVGLMGVYLYARSRKGKGDE